MDDDSGTAYTADQPRTPNPDLKHLDTLVGTGALSADVHGTYEWMNGGFFLIQHVNLQQQDGQHTKGMQIIGHLHPYGEEPSKDIHSPSYAWPYPGGVATKRMRAGSPETHRDRWRRSIQNQCRWSWLPFWAAHNDGEVT